MDERFKIRWPVLFLGILAMFLASLSLTGLWSGKRDVSHVEAADEQLLDQPFIRVIGTGKVTAVPDEAVFTIGVRTRASSADQAVKENARKMQAVIEALKKQGIAPADIQTQGYEIQQELDYPKEGNPRPNGYAAVNRLKVVVRQADRVGAVIDAATRAGANEAGGVLFRMSGEKEKVVAQQALEKALSQAGAKAQLLAERAGGKLGKVLAVDEEPGQKPPVVYREMAKYEMAQQPASDAATPVPAGELEYETQIRVVYQLR